MLQLLMVVTCCLAFLLAACIVPGALALQYRVRSSSLRCDFVQLGGWQKNGRKPRWRAWTRIFFFDLVKRWVSDTLHRTIQDTVPEGCPWQSISMAFGPAVPHFQNWSPPQVEEELRKYLARASSLTEPCILPCSRMRLPFSGRATARAWRLLHPSSYFTRGSKFRQQPDFSVVRLPLDFVDLQILSNKCQVGINIFRYRDEIRLT